METSCSYCLKNYTLPNYPVLLPCKTMNLCKKCYNYIFKNNNKECICGKSCKLDKTPPKNTDLTPLLVDSYNLKLIKSIKTRLPILQNESIQVSSKIPLDLSNSPKDSLPIIQDLFNEVRTFVIDLHTKETYHQALISKNSRYVDIVNSAEWVVENLDMKAISLPLNKKLRILKNTNSFELLSLELSKESLRDLSEQNTFNKELKKKLDCREMHLLGGDILWISDDWKIDFFSKTIFKICFMVDQPGLLLGIGTGFNRKLKKAGEVKRFMFYCDQYCLYQKDDWKNDESQETMNYEFKLYQENNEKLKEGINLIPQVVYSVIIISKPGRIFTRTPSSEIIDKNNYSVTLGDSMPEGFSPMIIENCPVSFFRIVIVN
jgi:hypothetical protein